ncbi:MAG: pantothenate synthetase [Actinomycetota bacterium]
MIVCTTPAQMQEWSRSQTADGRRVAVVPTMGALHDGHMALVDEARRHAEAIVVTIFVNPLQFDRPDDLAAYPRPIDDDLALCEARGVDAVYAPLAATMYPEGFQTGVTPGHLGELLEGAHRPGHFRGVTTVVAKLFHATRPDVAVFGEKDFQQLAILRRMTADLDFGIEVVGLPTVREADGLAMSSRNRRLTPEQRSAAVVVPRLLDAVAAATERRPVTTADLVAIATEVAAAEPLARFEHLDVVDAETLEHLTVVDGSRPAVALTAVWFGEVRLIDNRRL